MKNCLIISFLLSGLCSCGYHLGFSRPSMLPNARTMSVRMFDNNTLEPLAGVLLTNAVTDVMQRDGTFTLAASGKADIILEGEIKELQFKSVRPNPLDTYISSEIELSLKVDYRVIDRKTGKVVDKGTVTNQGNFYNEYGNVQNYRNNTLAYISQKIAEDIQFEIMSK